MPSSGMLRSVALVRTDVSEERNTSIIRVTRIGELGTTIVVTGDVLFLRSVCRLLVATNFPNSPILLALMMKALREKR
jgi:demethoxyubiquinone hydroxylase (CLK1/Coq7/Cat5 family)